MINWGKREARVSGYQFQQFNLPHTVFKRNTWKEAQHCYFVETCKSKRNLLAPVRMATTHIYKQETLDRAWIKVVGLYTEGSLVKQKQSYPKTLPPHSWVSYQEETRIQKHMHPRVHCRQKRKQPKRPPTAARQRRNGIQGQSETRI